MTRPDKLQGMPRNLFRVWSGWGSMNKKIKTKGDDKI